MAKFRITLNMEYCRSADKDFRGGVEIASKLGYQWVEPMVHTGWGLLSEVGYFHSFSMEEDPLFMKEICDENGIRVSSFSSHSPLMKPEAAVSRLTRAIIWATVIGCDFCNSDEMLKPDWMDDDFAHEAMKYTLTKVKLVAERHKKFVCLEPHGKNSRTARPRSFPQRRVRHDRRGRALTRLPEERIETLAHGRLMRPNILFIMSDDHAPHALSCYGSKINQTPNLDRIAREGVRFTRCYDTVALCAPARASLITGKYCHKHGFYRNEDTF